METKDVCLFVVHSQETPRGIFAQQLERLGYDVVVAANARQAEEQLLLQKSENNAPIHKFYLIIFDAKTIEAENFRGLQHFKNDLVLRHIPVLVMATAAETEILVKCLEYGADDYIIDIGNSTLLKARITGCITKAEPSSHPELSAKLERDLEIGRKIQTDFLPDKEKIPCIPGWNIAARLHPARMVAGDFFDAFIIGRNKIGVLIGDVCDKGVGPAMFMALIRSLLRAFAQQHRPLGWMDELTNAESDADESIREAKLKRQRILMSSGTSALLAVELTNNYVSDVHGEMNMFATLFFGVIDPVTGVLTYVNAGHEAPVIVGSNGVIKAHLMPTGPVVGIIPGSYYGIDQMKLERGDLMMTYTDGVPDARNPAGERFTDSRFFPLLQKPFSSVGVLLDEIEANLYAYIADADQFDDITMLAVRRESI